MIGAFQIAIHFATEPSLSDGVVGIPPDIDCCPTFVVNSHLPATSIGTVMGAGTRDNVDIGVCCVKGQFRHVLLHLLYDFRHCCVGGAQGLFHVCLGMGGRNVPDTPLDETDAPF